MTIMQFSLLGEEGNGEMILNVDRSKMRCISGDDMNMFRGVHARTTYIRDGFTVQESKP